MGDSSLQSTVDSGLGPDLPVPSVGMPSSPKGAAQLNGLQRDLDEVKARQAQRTGVLYAIVAGFLAWRYLPGRDFTWHLWAPWALLALAGVISALSAERIERVARMTLLVLPIVSHALVLSSYPEPAATYYGLLIVLTNAGIGPWNGVAAAVLDAACLWRYSPLPMLIPEALALYGLAIVVQTISFESLYTLLQYSWNSQNRANALLDQLRASRGTLNRTLDALTEASRRLERSNKELSLARQDADESRALREQFVVNISHELRTPLNLIVGFVEMMYLHPESYRGAVWTPELSADVGRMYRAGRHLESLISDILDLSRIDASRMPMLRELASLEQVIDEAGETIRPLLEQHHLTYRRLLHGELPDLLIDRTRIRQVMLNLLNNAVRFTEHGGISVRAILEQDRVVVSVDDTGVGISPEQVHHIFEKFAQAHIGPRSRGGAGLGLAISREFVRLHGGDMWAHSVVGQGSSFSFSLPLPGARLTYASDLTLVPPVPMRPDSGPVLVIDADPGIADLLSRHIGERTVCALPSLAGIDAVIEREHPSALILNQTPDSPDSSWVGALDEVCERYRLPVLRCSIPSASWMRGMTGMSECLTKPISRETLGLAVENHTHPGASILVVDDDAGFVSLVVRMLDSLGHDYRVRSAYGGRQALAACFDAPPDLILLDLLMPELDGFAFMDRLWADEALKGVVVVGVTATGYAEDMLSRWGARFTLYQSGGLAAGKAADLVEAALAAAQPDYARAVSTA